MKLYRVYLTIAACLLITTTGCDRVDEKTSDFSNVVYVENAKDKNYENLMLKAKDLEVVKIISAAAALPVDQDVKVKYKVDLSLVETYGKANYIDCLPLPTDFFNFPDTEALIPTGGVISSEVKVTFTNLETLPRNINYVLPITIVSNTGGVDILNKSKTIYYILKKGATITTAAYMSSNYIEFSDFKGNKSALQGMTEITMEALIRPREWKSISSIMGIEEYFLIRIGDTMPEDQVQIAYGSNLAGPRLGAPGQWLHLAVTFDRTTRRAIFYVNGVEVVNELCYFSPLVIDLTKTKTGTSNNNEFYVGKSFDDSRYFEGDMCEVRIWKTVRTESEIFANMYEVEPTSNGLVAYWKMDEGSGDNVNDSSGNGNHGRAKNALVWIPVELPVQP